MISSTPINDYNCECAVIGSLLGRSQRIAEVRDLLTDDCFYNARNRELYNALLELNDQEGTYDFVNLFALLRKHGSTFTPADILAYEEYMSINDPIEYALRLRDLASRRRLWQLGHQLIMSCQGESEELADIQQHAQSVIENLYAKQRGCFTTLAETYEEIHKQMMDNANHVQNNRGTLTGYEEIDRRGGLQPSDLIIIAGETSQGKTAFATSLALSAIQHDHCVAFYSMEMTALQLTARITAMQSGVTTHRILQEELDTNLISFIDSKMRTEHSARLFFDDTSTSSVDAILNSIRTMKIKHDIRGVLIDYLQIANVNMHVQNKEQAMGETARRLKNLAKELDIWIIALSQLNRNKDNPEPTMARLRDSGQIGEAADVVMLVYRPEYYGRAFPEPFKQQQTAGRAMIDVAKGRNCGVFKFLCGFDAARVHFFPLSELQQNAARSDIEQQKPHGEDMPF